MQQELVLVINCGSSSIKFALVDIHQPLFPLSGIAEGLGVNVANPNSVLKWQQNGEKFSEPLVKADHHHALSAILPRVKSVAGSALKAIGHRVVHGGEHFSQAQVVNAAVLDAVRTTIPLAPLHNPANLLGMEAALALFPDLPHVAVFDTALHQTLPEHAFRYALPESLYNEHRIRRYGFHGTSHQYVSRKAAEITGLPVDNSCWLTAHLGNGCSTAAIVNGESRDTSMGLTPLEGLVMGTRSGDIDPNLHGHLVRTLGWDIEHIDRVLNKESGLLGLSGLSNDMRTLEQARQEGHKGATLAIEVFCYRLAKSLASLSCALPRLDGLIFTGGIGENSALIREKTVAHLVLLDCKIDAEANRHCTLGKSGSIHVDGTTRILVIPTDEERQIAQESLEVIADASAISFSNQ